MIFIMHCGVQIFHDTGDAFSMEFLSVLLSRFKMAQTFQEKID